MTDKNVSFNVPVKDIDHDRYMALYRAGNAEGKLYHWQLFRALLDAYEREGGGHNDKA